MIQLSIRCAKCGRLVHIEPANVCDIEKSVERARWSFTDAGYMCCSCGAAELYYKTRT